MNINDIYKFNSISKDSSITGDLDLKNPTNIFGNIEGSIKMLTDDRIIQFDSSTIEGNIHCADIEIQGKVDGHIFSSGTVTVKSSAVINGRIESKSLVVYPGSELNIEAHSE